MKYVKFTYLTDEKTGGPVFPRVEGLEFAWAKESAYPTNSPEFFGAAPDSANTDMDGVIDVLTQEDFERQRAEEITARNPVPASCSWRQGQKALLRTGKLDSAKAFLADIEDPFERQDAEIEFGAPTYERASPFLQQVWSALGGTSEELDDLFRLAVTL